MKMSLGSSCFHLLSLALFWSFTSALFGLGSAQNEGPSTDPVEVAALNSIFEQWNISSSMATITWNTTGDPCSGNATLPTSQNLNFRDDDVKFNPAILCSCDSNNTCHIIRLKATNLQIVGTIPDELRELKYLNNLQIAKNYLTGPLPAFFGSFSDMLYLSVGLNSLSGPLPKELGNLSKLISLGLGSRNNFSGPIPPELGNLTNLEQMYVDSNGLEGEIPDTLVNLQKLKTLWASDNNFGGRVPDFLGNLTRLMSLRLQGNSFEGPIPSSFASLVRMNDLRLGDITNGSSTLEFIRNMNSLNILILRNCMISDTIPTYIEEFSNMTYLDLSFNNLTGKLPSSLFNMPSLTTLYLGNNSISGSLPDQKANELENIDLSYNQLSGGFPEWVTRTNNALNLVANNFATETNSLPLGLRCLQRDVPCSRGSPNYYSFAINCGGRESITSNGTIYESDDNNLSGASYYMTSTQRWAVSSVGTFMDNSDQHYDLDTSTNISNTSDSKLFQSARLSPSSLRYYGLGLENGNYTVALQFAEIRFPNDRIWQSFGKRIFDIYVQGILVEKEFDIWKESSERSFSATKKVYLTSVTDNFLEIHFFWAGKGTCCIPFDGSYGSLISAISVTPNFVPTVSNQPPNTDSTNMTGLVVGIVIGVSALLIILVSGLWMWRQRKIRNAYRYNFPELNELTIASDNFSYMELKNATGDFSPKNKLGEGGFGAVYMGRLSNNDRIVAVKELTAGSSQGKQQFVAEVSIISKVKHRNLVNLYGCCYEGNKRLLVYEYMENKSLDQALFGNTGLYLDWPTRYKICLGTAKGLTYLHEESRYRIIHRDIKSSNILLDADLSPKISDFGLAKLYDDKMTHIITKVAGTTGYLAPEYAMRGHLTEKVDVYAFGIVILEILSGRSIFRPKLDDDKYLIEWVWELHEANRDIEVIDSTLSAFNKEEVERATGVAFLCTQMNHLLRPKMSLVVSMLLGEVELGEVPSKPSYIAEWNYDDLSEIGETSSSFPFGNTQSSTFG